ncbi:hypothetical protein MASR2M15_07420 [Anaerolineales bacterium]
MLHIAYTESDNKLAKQLKNSLKNQTIKLYQPMLVVLLSPAALADAKLQTTIEEAQAEGKDIFILLTEGAQLPAHLQALPHQNYSQQTDLKALTRKLNQLSIGNRKQANRKALFVVGGIALIMFIISVYAISNQLIAFPQDEFDADATRQADMIATFIMPTLEAAQPRTTADAESFPLTLDAAPKRNQGYLEATATALSIATPEPSSEATAEVTAEIEGGES